jgi:hypothetical protein
MSLIAAELLTESRAAALRIEPPPSTATTILRRRSWDSGAVMLKPHVAQPPLTESGHPNPCNTKLL